MCLGLYLTHAFFTCMAIYVGQVMKETTESALRQQQQQAEAARAELERSGQQQAQWVDRALEEGKAALRTPKGAGMVVEAIEGTVDGMTRTAAIVENASVTIIPAATTAGTTAGTVQPTQTAGIAITTAAPGSSELSGCACEKRPNPRDRNFLFVKK